MTALQILLEIQRNQSEIKFLFDATQSLISSLKTVVTDADVEAEAEKGSVIDAQLEQAVQERKKREEA